MTPEETYRGFADSLLLDVQKNHRHKLTELLLDLECAPPQPMTDYHSHLIELVTRVDAEVARRGLDIDRSAAA